MKTEYEYYHDLLRPHVGKKISGWEFVYDENVGTFYFEKGDKVLYTTPYWEDTKGIAVSFDVDGNNLFNTVIFIEPILDNRADLVTYFKSIFKFINTVFN